MALAAVLAADNSVILLRICSNNFASFCRRLLHDCLAKRAVIKLAQLDGCWTKVSLVFFPDFACEFNMFEQGFLSFACNVADAEPGLVLPKLLHERDKCA